MSTGIHHANVSNKETELCTSGQHTAAAASCCTAAHGGARQARLDTTWRHFNVTHSHSGL